jgi:hypothetical protein
VIGCRHTLAPALAVAALMAAACGADPEPAEKAKPVGDVLVGSVAPLAQCADWRAGTRAERLATIDDIREQVNLQDSAVKTPELSDKVAYRVLDTTCRKPFAAGFRLYKLYARAAGFAAFAED